MADPAELLEHVKDSNSFHLPLGAEFHLPQILGFQVTRFMVLELAAAAVMIAVFVPVGQRIASGKAPRGRWWNMIEAMIVFIRDQVARPAIGKHEADRFLPFLWTMFFFILFLNLIGLVPWCGSATGAIGVTAALAAITLAMVIGGGVKKFGLVRFWTGQVPHMDVPFVTLILLWPMLFALEVVGMLVRHVILAVRLFANMFAGHLVLAAVLGFIAMTAGLLAWYGVMPASVLGAVALSLLELIVALIQAYVFTYLAALFIGMAVHQH